MAPTVRRGGADLADGPPGPQYAGSMSADTDTPEAPADDPRAKARRPRWALLGAVAVVLLWLLVGGIGGQAQGKLAGVQSNDNSTFLPRRRSRPSSATRSRGSARAPSCPTRRRRADRRRTPRRRRPRGGAALRAVGALPRAARPRGRPDARRLPRAGVAGRARPRPGRRGGARVGPARRHDGHRGLRRDDAARRGRRRPARGAAHRPRGRRARGYVGPGRAHRRLLRGVRRDRRILLLVALVVVLVILLVVYRSPILPIAVLVSAVLGLSAAAAVVYQLAKNDVITLSGQSQGILFILVVGAATDYALLLVSRFKEALHDEESSWVALTKAWRGAVEPVGASAATVIIGLLCLLLAELRSTSGLGPVGALGIAGALLASLTFLPAVLLLFGRRIFWPFAPKVDHAHAEDVVAPPAASGAGSPASSARTRAAPGSSPSSRCSRRRRSSPRSRRAARPSRRPSSPRSTPSRAGGHREALRGRGRPAAAGRRPAGGRRGGARARLEGPRHRLLPRARAPRSPARTPRRPRSSTATCCSRRRPRTRPTAQGRRTPSSGCAPTSTPSARTRSSGQRGHQPRRPRRQRARPARHRPDDPRGHLRHPRPAPALARRAARPRRGQRRVLRGHDRDLGPRLRPRARLHRRRPRDPVVRLRVPRRAGHRLLDLPHDARPGGVARARYPAGCARGPRRDRRGHHERGHRPRGDLLGAVGAAHPVPRPDRVHRRLRRAARHLRRPVAPRARDGPRPRSEGVVAGAARRRRRAVRAGAPRGGVHPPAADRRRARDDAGRAGGLRFRRARHPRTAPAGGGSRRRGRLDAGCRAGGGCRSDLPGVEVVADLDALLAVPDLDLVVLATPSGGHAQQVRTVVDAASPASSTSRSPSTPPRPRTPCGTPRGRRAASPSSRTDATTRST